MVLWRLCISSWLRAERRLIATEKLYTKKEYLLPRVLTNCIGTPLSEAELRALKGLLSGKTYKEMGAEFACAPSTIATHIMWVRRKWGVMKASRGALLLEYIRRREEVLTKALDLLGIAFPGRTCDEKTWDNWRQQCASAQFENERVQKLL